MNLWGKCACSVNQSYTLSPQDNIENLQTTTMKNKTKQNKVQSFFSLSLLTPRRSGKTKGFSHEKKRELSQPPTHPRTILGRQICMAKSSAGPREPSVLPKWACSASEDSFWRHSGKCCAELHPVWAKQISSLPGKGSGQLSRATPCAVAGGCHYKAQIGHNYMLPGEKA